MSVEGSDPGASMESQVWTSEGMTLTVLSNTPDGAAKVNDVLTTRLSTTRC